jgi:hypothetical protein
MEIPAKLMLKFHDFLISLPDPEFMFSCKLLIFNRKVNLQKPLFAYI